MNPILFNDVHRHFGGVGVLRGLSLEVRPGEVFALLGRNGEGKTTALRTLLGFLEPMRGEVRVLGKRSAELEPADRLRIGYVPEGQPAFERMVLPIGELLDMEEATRSNLRRSWAEDQARRFELPTDRPVSKLSRGQKAQLALILALAGRPEVMVLDDPAMGLDAVVRRDFLNAVIEYLADEGSTVLFSSHILPDVERLADRVGLLGGGTLIVDAPVDELKRRITKRFASAENGATPPADLPGLLRSRAVPGGFELTLLDPGDGVDERLAARGLEAGEPETPTLEELFCDLTEAGRGGRARTMELPR